MRGGWSGGKIVRIVTDLNDINQGEEAHLIKIITPLL